MLIDKEEGMGFLRSNGPAHNCPQFAFVHSSTIFIKFMCIQYTCNM